MTQKLFSPILLVQRRLARRKRIRTALHMLSASGVLRPGHVEFHYTTPLTRKRLGHSHSSHVHGSVQQAPIWADQFRLHISHIKQRVMGVGPEVLANGRMT
ncbi:MAG TPA: hypothetical protein VIU63_10055 [Nitrospira sp.]